MEVDGKYVTKIGMTMRLDIELRVCEILTSYFKCYRYFPYCKPMKFTKTLDPLAKEQILLEYFKEYKYESLLPFGGCTELVDVDNALIKLAYKKVLADEQLLEINELRKELDELQSIDDSSKPFRARGTKSAARRVTEIANSADGRDGCTAEGLLDSERMARNNDGKSKARKRYTKTSERTK